MDSAARQLDQAVRRARDRAEEAEQRLARDAAPPAVQAAVSRARAELDALTADLGRDRRAA